NPPPRAHTIGILFRSILQQDWCTSACWIAPRFTRRPAIGKWMFTIRPLARTAAITGQREISGSRFSRRDAWSHGIQLLVAKCGMLTSLFREVAERWPRRVISFFRAGATENSSP